jgi:tyrosine-protein kinase Etk/Wzc
MQEKNIEQEEENLVNQLLFKFLPYWPLFLVLMLIAAGGAWYYLKNTSPKYEASATIILKDEKKGADDSKILEQLNLINTKKIIENEVVVLKSISLMDYVARDLKLYAPVFVDEKKPDNSAYQISPILIEAAYPDSILKSENIYFTFDPKEEVVVLNKKEKYPLNNFFRTPFGVIRFITNPYYNQYKNQTPLYFKLYPIRSVAKSLASRLSVSAAGKMSSVISLKYEDEVPKRAEDILNSLIDNYDKSAINEKNNLAENTLAFVEDRLNVVTKDLDSIEKRIQQYRSGQGAIDIGTQGNLFLRNVSENDQKLSEVNMKLAVLDQVENFVESKENSGGIVPSTLGVNDPILSQLLEKLYTSELEYERLKTTVAENNPMLVSVKDQINKIRPSIKENIQSQRNGLIASRNNINSTNSMYNSMLSTMPQKERQLLDISREQQIKSNIYSFLLQKREESVLSSSSNVSDSRVLDYAQVSNSPVSPKSKTIYIGSIALAFLLSIGLVSARDALNGKILYRQDLENYTKYPVIGEIAYKKTDSPIVIQRGKRTFVAEEFRKIRMTLPHLGIGEASKKILITSSIPGEGKSFISANLATSLALIEKKVVLIDADLNNPSLVHIFNCEGKPGVSEFLQGTKDPEQIITRVKETENLFFIPPGNLPDSPAELLSNGKMKELIEYLDPLFDYILIDTAPVVPVTDAYLITPHCDATLFVMRHNYTPKAFVKRFDQNNKINTLKNPGIIFNGVKGRGIINSKNGYGYGYGYVYDYTPSKKNKKSYA